MIRTLIETVSQAVQPWSDLYAGSTALSTTVEFLHLGGLLVAGGLALSFDRAALRTGSRTLVDRTRFVNELREVHRPVLLALLVVILSGFALMLADFDAMLESKVFWLKMSVFIALMVNGFMVRRAGRLLERDVKNAARWRSLERGSIRSMGLWIAVVFLGVLLTGV